MTEEAKPTGPQVGSWPFALPNPVEMGIPTGWAFHHQGEFIDRMLGNMATRIKRHQEAMEVTLRAVSAACAARDTGQLIAAYGEWLKRQHDCIIADIAEARDETLRWTEFGQKAVTMFSPGPGTTSSPGTAANEIAGEGPQRTRTSG